ncbi:DUF255 domain-containing protein [Streptomyces bacillaris]
MNRLAGVTSPYLLQHAENPVDWWPWSPEAFEEARKRGVPVLLSVGMPVSAGANVLTQPGSPELGCLQGALAWTRTIRS